MLLIPSASAHTQLVSSNPAVGATVAEFPSEVSLRFSENLLHIGDKNPMFEKKPWNKGTSKLKQNTTQVRFRSTKPFQVLKDGVILDIFNNKRECEIKYCISFRIIKFISNFIFFMLNLKRSATL